MLWDVACEIAAVESDVVLELGLVQQAERVAVYEKARLAGAPVIIRLLGAPREVRRERVARRNAEAGPTTQAVPAEMFEVASDAWEPPTEAERATWGILDA